MSAERSDRALKSAALLLAALAPCGGQPRGKVVVFVGLPIGTLPLRR